jgi:hypothetical protein
MAAVAVVVAEAMYKPNCAVMWIANPEKRK